MAQQIQELINKIKEEGVTAAENKARDIEQEAKKKAQEIIDHAKKESEKLLREAKIDIEKLEKSSRMNLTQAARDMLLSLRVEIQNMLKKVIDQKITDTLTTDHLASIVGKMAERVLSQQTAAEDIQIILSPEDLKKLKEGFLSEVEGLLKKGIKLQASEDVTKGMLISFDGGKSSFDFTHESLAQYLSVYLNAQLASVMDESVKK